MTGMYELASLELPNGVVVIGEITDIREHNGDTWARLKCGGTSYWATIGRLRKNENTRNRTANARVV